MSLSTLRFMWSASKNANIFETKCLNIIMAPKRWASGVRSSSGSAVAGKYIQELTVAVNSAFAPFNSLDTSKYHVDFYSFDYVGLGKNKELSKVYADAILCHDMDFVYSNPDLSAVVDTQREYARWLKSESAVLTSSGKTANIGVMEILLRGNARPVYLDHFAHKTFHAGVQLAGAASRMRMFRHNNLDHLRSLISKSRGGGGEGGVVVVDSVYSPNGGEAPLPELVDLCRENGCILVVDESHALGAMGERGEGMVVDMGLQDGVHVRTSSLSKALSCELGVVASTSDVTDCYNATVLSLFSKTMQVPSAIKARKALELVSGASAEREYLRNLTKSFRQQLKGAGYPVNTEVDNPIVALIVGDFDRTTAVHRLICSRGVFPYLFAYPATPRNGCLVRFAVNQNVSPEKMEHTIEIMKELREELEPWTWKGWAEMTQSDTSRHAQICDPPRPLQEGVGF